MPNQPSFDPAYADIGGLRVALDVGRIGIEELVRYYLTRIERLDKQGPRINALITLNANALRQARQLDLRAKMMAGKPPLYGIPFIAKDNYDTAGIPTSGGSAVLLHSVPSADAFVIRKLLDQGAILIGKANMSELAASHGRLGYSSAGGLTLNPYNLARDASGSSSGSAAALAADFAAFALGTDTSGSVRAPGSVAGLVGLRPTWGLISRTGTIPLSPTFDTPGVLARSVRDLAIVLDAIAGPDPRDAATLAQPAHADYADSLSEPAIRGVRLGVVENFRGGNSEVDEVEQASLMRLASLGAVLIAVTLPTSFDHLWDTVLRPAGEAEFKRDFERYLRSSSPFQPQTLAELIERGESAHLAAGDAPVNPALLAALRIADASALSDSPAQTRLLTQAIPAIRAQLQSLFDARKLRALVFSTMSCPASPRFDRPDARYVCHVADPYRACYVAAAAGCPEITVPAGRIDGNLPVGFSFLGLPYSEPELLAMAHAFQMAGPSASPPLP